MTEILARPCRPEDVAACLAIFDGNVPQFFAPGERAEFCAFLRDPETRGGPYLVLTQGEEVSGGDGKVIDCGGLKIANGGQVTASGGLVIACGGLEIDTATRRASLTWGMVDRAHHGQGLGTRLTRARIALARATPGIDEVLLATSQHSRSFYEGLGFTAQGTTPDGFGPGLDRWDMTLRLAGE